MRAIVAYDQVCIYVVIASMQGQAAMGVKSTLSITSVVALFCLGVLPATLKADMSAPIQEPWAAYEAARDKGDFSETVRSLTPLAEAGDAEAQAGLGAAYVSGKGVTIDEAAAAMWSRKSAGQGNPKGQFVLGMLYENGWGVPLDYLKAAELYRLASDQGMSEAQLMLGMLFDNGHGVKQDYAQAYDLYLRAAQQGQVKAQGFIGDFYAFGRGVPQDYAQAAHWLRKAADQGDHHAQLNLGALHAEGLGVKKDYLAAYMWFSLGAADTSNADTAKKSSFARDYVATLITPAQLVEAKAQVAAWKPLK